MKSFEFDGAGGYTEADVEAIGAQLALKGLGAPVFPRVGK